MAAVKGKGMNQVALVEFGSGCCHFNNSTKAAIRACNDAIEWNSVKVRTIIPGSYDAMKIHVHLSVPAPETVDMEAIKGCFPYGPPPEILVEHGGQLGSTRAGLPGEEPNEGLMTIACACVTVGWQDDQLLETDAPGATGAAATENSSMPPLQGEPPPTVPLPPASPPPGPSPAPAQPPTRDSAPRAREAALGRAPTPAELTPGSPEMLARATEAQAKWADRVLTPLEAFTLIADEDDIEMFDVRTQAQRVGHEINGRKGVSAKGAMSVPLDDLVGGKVPLPAADIPVILVCSRGPKSLVALDYLAEVCPRAICIEGGVTAWDEAKLPTDEMEDFDLGDFFMT